MLFAAKIWRCQQVLNENVSDLAQLLDQKHTLDTGTFYLEGSTNKFPATQTEIQPFVTIHHNCDMDEKQTANVGVFVLLSSTRTRLALTTGRITQNEVHIWVHEMYADVLMTIQDSEKCWAGPPMRKAVQCVPVCWQMGLSLQRNLAA